MCDPVTLTTALVVSSVASTAASLVGQQQSAEAQRAAIEQQLQLNYDNTAKQQQAQENDQLRASRREESRIKVAAGEAGLSLGSQSIEMMLLDNQMQTGLNTERIGLNTDIQRQNLESDANHMMSQTATASPLGAGLQLGLSGLNGFVMGKSLQAKSAATSRQAASGAVS